ncbi:MAG: potassium channel protein [Candidatus Koribacter versatilis]|uniref:Potassium channel protein n=1 Tax=Candidatus Korobacter versatilis TaxID=658062 RepID=A0A932A888_9BACT|nr:potassium channel protein [Candidatus Koribacter versatilis]
MPLKPSLLRPLRNLKIVLTLLAGLAVAGTVGFRVIEGWPWLDCFYMVVTTFTTVGYMEIHPLSHAGRIFNLFVIMFGVGTVFLAIGSLTQALLEFELSKVFGQRRMERDIDKLAGHYIICGAGRVGRSVARELARKPAPFLVIETSEARTDALPEGWLLMRGDATLEKTLRAARIEHAEGLVAATTTDATNIYIVLTARGLNPKLRIIARASEEDAEKHLRTAGADSIISPYSFAGHRIAQQFLRPNVLDFLDLATLDPDVDLEIEEVQVSPRSTLAGVSIGDSRIHQQLGVIVLAIKREGQTMKFNPAAADRIEPNDFLIAIGESKSLRRLEQTAAAAAGR